MCLTVSFQHPYKYVAGYNMLVWKRLRDVNEQSGISPYQGTTYVFGQPMTSRIGRMSSKGNIYEGLHSYYTKDAARQIARRAEKALAWHESICPAIVPKGAEFYVGVGNEVVSNQLIVYHPDRRFKQTGKANFAKHKVVANLLYY